MIIIIDPPWLFLTFDIVASFSEAEALSRIKISDVICCMILGSYAHVLYDLKNEQQTNAACYTIGRHLHSRHAAQHRDGCYEPRPVWSV